MEIVAIVVVIFVVILIIGSMDNARPVSSWSDEKLQRMYGKLLNAATVNNRGGNSEKANEHFQKAEEVKKEIEARIKKRDFELHLNKTMVDAAPIIQKASQNFAELIQKIMAEQNVNLEQARQIVGKRMAEAKAKYVGQGMNDDQADEAVMKEIFKI